MLKQTSQLITTVVADINKDYCSIIFSYFEGSIFSLFQTLIAEFPKCNSWNSNAVNIKYKNLNLNYTFKRYCTINPLALLSVDSATLVSSLGVIQVPVSLLGIELNLLFYP